MKKINSGLVAVRKRNTYITVIPAIILSLNWKVSVEQIINTAGGIFHPVFVRCNKKGQVNFDTTCQYSVDEVIGKENFVFVKHNKK